MSDVDFPEDENLIVSRDYLYTYIWDIRNPTTHTFKTAVFPTINNQICEMYQESKIFDRFQVKTNRDCSKIITTHYEDSFHKILVNEVDVVLLRSKTIDSSTRPANRRCRK